MAGRLQAQGEHDTIMLGAVQVGNETFPMMFIEEVEVTGPVMDPKRREEIRRLRYNVYKVYPYAVTAAFVLNKVDKEMAARS
ncbi:MAG TPA: DUF4294 domain-containing protein, partial [Chitinophagaceae bacterium]|nr:DUF4294 domain-containing protein [Chitinophagaceae bacterium]